MKKIGLGFLTVLIMIAGVNLAHAQDAVSAEKTALIKELMEASGGKKLFNEVMSSSMSMQEVETQRVINDLTNTYKGVTPPEKAMITKMANESAERIRSKAGDFFVSRFDFDKFVDDVFVPIYSKHFADNELRDMIAFYHSPTGQKMVKETPQMMIELIPAMVSSITPIFIEFMNATRNEEMTALKQKLPKKKTTRGS